MNLFIGVAVGLPLLLAAIGRRRRSTDTGHAEPDTLKEWLRREFVVYTGTMQGRIAAIEVLLPLAAVAFGMTLFAIVHHLDIGA